MTLLTISVLILTCLIAKACSEILHCYECDDCKTSNNTLLRACPQTNTTIIPDNLIPDSTTMSSTTTITATSSPSSTTITSTSSPSSTTTSTAPEPSDTKVTVLESVSTLTPVSASSATGTDVENNEGDTEKVLKRSVRQVNYRALMIRRFAREIDVSHHCYSIKGYGGGDQKKIKKGCVKVIGNKNACDVLKEQYDVPAENCVVCKENRCNNSAVRNFYSVSYPVLVLMICFLIRM